MIDLISGYSIIQKLGDGARSQVYQVVETATGKNYALKRVTRESHEDHRFLEQAITGYRIAKAVNHSYLQKAYELRRIRRFFRLIEVQVVMEYFDGVGLDRCRPERIDQAVSLFIKVAEGLQAMHEANYLHTDIKPNNVLVTATGELKIIDFGQSCPIGFRKSRIQGTPDYIAPEQVERQHLSRQTDIFNLGATLYWALTGQSYPTLITKKGQRYDAKSIAAKPIPTPLELNPEVPSGLSQLVMECCMLDPQKRPRGMKEVISRMETVKHVLAAQGKAVPDGMAKDNFPVLEE